ncbi:phage tail protein [Herbaspirillum huttiense]|uniref:Phage tail protein n=2 Tax=Herbaspirillum huttiense TaxID=863372 RepID=A0AAJ2HA68_9BURK|nr:phage tail protein [Herbaspirillum huttiense]MDR9839649.1 phage tail protein [Herbaspirillum huttiense]
MQVLERSEGDRDRRVASEGVAQAGYGEVSGQVIHSSQAGHASQSPPPARAASVQPDLSEEELEVRASHITAAAVAAAAVTAAVATSAGSASLPYEDTAAAPAAQEEPAAQTRRGPRSEPEPRASTRGALLVSLLTLAIIGVALWVGAQWPQRSLKPVMQQLPSLSKATPVDAVAPPASLDHVEPAATDAAPGPEVIAQLQQEADDKARQLAQKRAAAEARHRREDAALALREQRRREAEAQLANARAKAERAQAVVPVPEVVEVQPVPTLAEQVKQCNTLSVFARESCLWKLCDGKWGKNGCPSYERNNEGA